MTVASSSAVGEPETTLISALNSLINFSYNGLLPKVECFRASLVASLNA
jgi:hypothetical protein